jgi:hypothetical protein
VILFCAEKLADYLDGSKASKLASKLDDILYDYEKSKKGGKRDKFKENVKENTEMDVDKDENGKAAADDNNDNNNTSEGAEGATEPQSVALSKSQIEEMMLNAQRLIMERKKAFEQNQSAPMMPNMVGPRLPARLPAPVAQFMNRTATPFTRHPANANFRMQAVVASGLAKPNVTLPGETQLEKAKRIAELQVSTSGILSSLDNIPVFFNT